MMLPFEHNAKIIAIYTIKSLQYYSTLIFINYIGSSTYFLFDSACFEDTTAEGACLLYFDPQCMNSANNH
jgi:hypothetical protein